MSNNKSYQNTSSNYAVVPLIDSVRDYIGDNILFLSRDGNKVILNDKELEIWENLQG